jgi:3-oxoacyl-[acyl-carrier-protein] synthase-3
MLKISTYLPPKILSNQDLQLEFPDYNVEKLGKKIGIEERRVCGPNETPIDLAEKACLKLFKEVDASSIDFLIYCTQSPEYFLPTSACILQDRLNLNKNCGAFDYNLGCSGYVYGLAMAKSFIASGIAKNVLIVTAEAYSKHVDSGDITNRAIFGDAATATFIDKSFTKKIGEFNLGTDGSGAKNIIVKGGGVNNNFKNSFEKDDRFYMNGPEVFKFTLDNVPLSIEDCLKKNKLEKSEINYFILHQANKYMLNNIRRKLGVEKDIFFNNMINSGNSVSNTIPIALKKALDEGLIKSEDKVLLSGFGVGYSWGSTVINL